MSKPDAKKIAHPPIGKIAPGGYVYTYIVISCANCGVLFAINNAFYSQRQDGQTFYCPYGHAQYYDTVSRKYAKAEEEKNRTAGKKPDGLSLPAVWHPKKRRRRA